VSARRRWYIICDCCGEISDHTQQTAARARQIARYIRKGHHDYCSQECASKGPAEWAL
jgi:hypothetical protein